YQAHHVLALPRVGALVQVLRAQGFLREPAPSAHQRLGRQLAGRAGRKRAFPRAVRLAPERLLHALLHTRWALDGVDGLVGRWYQAWGWVLFTRPLLLLGTVLGLLSPLLFLLEMQRGRYNLLAFATSSATAIAALWA